MLSNEKDFKNIELVAKELDLELRDVMNYLELMVDGYDSKEALFLSKLTKSEAKAVCDLLHNFKEGK